MRALLHRRVHAASTPIHAKCRDSEIPFLLLQSPPHACRKQTGRLLELFSQPIQLFKDLTVGVHLPFLSPPLVCFSLLAESAVKVVFLILPKLQTQHPFGVSGCITALKSGVLARCFSIKTLMSNRTITDNCFVMSFIPNSSLETYSPNHLLKLEKKLSTSYRLP